VRPARARARIRAASVPGRAMAVPGDFSSLYSDSMPFSPPPRFVVFSRRTAAETESRKVF